MNTNEINKYQTEFERMVAMKVNEFYINTGLIVLEIKLEYTYTLGNPIPSIPEVTIKAELPSR